LLDGPGWLPAVCQGVIGIEAQARNARAKALLAAIGDLETSLAVACERAFLAALDGSCRTPVAALARTEGARLAFEGEVLTPDGRKAWRASRMASHVSQGDAAAMGRDAAEEIRARAGGELPVP
jgi:hydroxymethylbilane synthase